MDTKNIFVKFSVNSTLNLASSFEVSTDRLDFGSTPRPPRSDKSPEGHLSSDDEARKGFAQLSRDIMRRNEGFIRAAPLLLSLLPIASNIEVDRKLRRYVSKHHISKEIRDDEEIYELPIAHLRELQKRTNALVEFYAGIPAVSQMLIMGLASAYDAFLAELIRTMLSVRPEILNTSERSMSLKELMSIGSIEDARDMIIDQEIDRIMRQSHADQITWIEQRTKLQIKDSSPLWPQYIEFFERRNLFAHTAGVVSTQYLKSCQAAGIKTADLKIGDRIDAPLEYLQSSIDLLTEFGVKLTQFVWRKLAPDELEIAVQDLADIGYQLIAGRRYRLAEEILRFGLHESKQGNDAIRKRMIVNYANAVKLGGDKPRATKILAAEDWSATPEHYLACVNAIRDDVAGTLKTLRTASNAKGITIQEVRDWPVFGPLRDDPTFIEGVEAIFGEPLSLPISKVSKLELQAPSTVEPLLSEPEK